MHNALKQPTHLWPEHVKHGHNNTQVPRKHNTPHASSNTPQQFRCNCYCARPDHHDSGC